MENSTPLVRNEQVNGVAVITLSSPETGNALGVDMVETLFDKVQEVANDTGARAVLLTGEGRFFCVGGDVKSMVAAKDEVGMLLDRITKPLHAAIATLLQMPKPLIVAVNGPVAGGGLGLAVAGDIVLASDKAHFSMAYGGIGFSPDGASTWLLPRLIGLRRTQELAFTNLRLTSTQAVECGLITQVVDGDALAQEAREMAENMAKGPVSAFAATRSLLLSADYNSPEVQMKAEAASVRAQAEGPEGKEGIAAFLAKRPPIFSP